MSEDDDSEKEHEPSQKRLDEARKRGDIPRSTELSSAASYAGLLLACGLGGTALLQQGGVVFSGMLERSTRLAEGSALTGPSPTVAAFLALAPVIAPLFLLPAFAVVGTILAQRAFVFAPEKLSLKWSRLSPLANARQKFGVEGLFDFGKSLVKMAVFSGILGLILINRAPEILESHTLTPALATGLMLRIFVEFLTAVVLISVTLGAVDYLWQRNRHIKRNRMSRKDMMDEFKEAEGDPHLRQKRRQRGQDIATNRMLQDVPKADVIVVNPTHYAVALKWNRTAKGAPICVAKGTDEIAARIREKAALAGVPIHSDPPTARAIHASVKIGSAIKPEHYRAVAVAIRFAEAMQKRKRGMAK